MASLTTEARRRTGATVYVVRWREGGASRKRRVGTDRRLAEAALLDAMRVEQDARGATETARDGAELVARFLDAMRLKGLREATLAYYRQRLEWWLARHPGVPPARWTRALLERTLAEQAEWAPRTKGMLVAALRRLRRWARKGGAFMPDLTDELEMPVARPRSRAPLSGAEADRLLDAVKEHRYGPAVALALCAGLSLGDVRSITWGEVDLDAGWVMRRDGRQKTGVVLRVPILPELAEALRRARPLHPAPTEAVCTGLAKSRRANHETLRAILERAGIQRAPGESWHLLRHSFGTMLMRAGVPAAVIGRLLSHRPGSVVTQQYIHPDDGDLVRAMEALKAWKARGAQA